jgi:hypothetical protein
MTTRVHRQKNRHFDDDLILVLKNSHVNDSYSQGYVITVRLKVERMVLGAVEKESAHNVEVEVGVEGIMLKFEPGSFAVHRF